MFDINSFKEVTNNIEESVNIVDEFVNNTVLGYTHDLDKVMNLIHNEIIAVEEPAMITIEKYFMELSNLVYFVASRFEKASIYSDISKINYSEAYNENYLEGSSPNANTGKKPTVAEIQASAEIKTINEQVVSNMYARIDKMIKAKLSAAQTMISTLSKVLTRRYNECSLPTPNVRTLVEDSGMKNSDFESMINMVPAQEDYPFR